MKANNVVDSVFEGHFEEVKAPVFLCRSICPWLKLKYAHLTMLCFTNQYPEYTFWFTGKLSKYWFGFLMLHDAELIA